MSLTMRAWTSFLVTLFICWQDFEGSCSSNDAIIFPPHVAEVPGELIGHLKPYGYQRLPEGPVVEYNEPLPAQEFWQKHVKPHTPLVYRQAINKSPALKSWTDEYLSEKYGKLDVLVELKKENRTSTSGRMQLKDFLKLYKHEELYVVSMLPSEMMVDVQAVSSVMCGTFRNFTHESNLWISSGGTRSVIHYDADHNLHCMIAGRKDFMMIQNKYSEDLYFGPKPKGVGSGYSKLDPDMVDMNLYPNHGKVPWTWATLYPGDCIFIPSVYIHQVRSYGRSIAVTTLFTADLHDNFSSEDCTPEVMTQYHKMSDIDFRWTYRKGDETIDMGFMNDKLVSLKMEETIKSTDPFRNKDGRLYWKHFIRFGFTYPHMRIALNYSKAKEVFQHLNQGKGYIDLDMVKNYTRQEMKLCVRLIESPHGIVTDGKQKILAKPGERNKFDDAQFQVSEVMKFIKDAKVTRRMQEHYWREIFEEEEDEEENERDDEEEPGQDRNSEDVERKFKNQKRRAEEQEEDNDDGDEEDGTDATEGAGSEVDSGSKDPKADRDEL